MRVGRLQEDKALESVPVLVAETRFESVVLLEPLPLQAPTGGQGRRKGDVPQALSTLGNASIAVQITGKEF